MAPKRSAPPPPPAASSEETASGSGSEESESEEEIAHSPPPAARKTKAPSPQVEEEEEEEEEEEDEDDEEDEEDEKANQATPPAVPKNPPPPPPNREESESEEEDEEGDDEDEAPQPKPAQAEGKGSKPPPPPPSSGEDKKPSAPFQRLWSVDDEVRILEALAEHRREHGALPDVDALAASLAGRVDNTGFSTKELYTKLRALKSLYSRTAKREDRPTKDRDLRLFELSRAVWGGKAQSGSARREPGEMCELYPYLAEEVRAVQKAHPGLFKREFEMIDDDKARALDTKIKKQRLVQMKVELRRYDLTKEVARTLMELVE